MLNELFQIVNRSLDRDQMLQIFETEDDADVRRGDNCAKLLCKKIGKTHDVDASDGAQITQAQVIVADVKFQLDRLLHHLYRHMQSLLGESQMKIEELIAVVDAAYDDGLILKYFESPDEEHGDGLARFICREIHETFSTEASDIEQVGEAQRVIAVAQKQVALVNFSLQKFQERLEREAEE
ncbi:MAG: hypothetical protein DRP01_00075 [Archaeoglobales archaeon]|nr:MAG: hypothetical protein DRP01_00075 [Archaeoglobales archaeon]